MYGFLVQESFYYTTFQKVFLNYFFHIVNRNLAVERTLGVDNHNRSQCTKTETAGLDNFNFFIQTLFDKLLFHLIGYLTAL